MQPQQDFYDPALEGLAKDMQMVLKGKPFKPLRNKKTGNFFSYSFGVATRNQSANADDDIEWIDFDNKNIPKEIRDKGRKIKALHDEQVQLHVDLREAVTDEDKRAVRKITKEIAQMFVTIDEAIYPESEREYVESKEAERFRLEQQGELKLDAASIAALTGNMNPPADTNPGATADLSIAQAKLDLAEKQAAEARDTNADLVKRMEQMQKLFDAQIQAQADTAEKKPASRKKAGVKTAE